MVLQTQQMTVEEFDRFALQPENADKLLEYIAGEIVEVVSNSYSSEIALLIAAPMTIFVRQNNLGRVTGADGGYRVMGERYIPDVAFTSKIKQPEPSLEAYNPNPPDLAVEVLSPTNDERDMRIKVVNDLRAGAIVWVVDPDRKQVDVFSPTDAPKTLGLEDHVDGADALPGFSLAVKDIFPQ